VKSQRAWRRQCGAGDVMRADAAGHRQSGPEPAVVAQQAIDYTRALAQRDLNPLVAVLGSRAAPPAFHQYPEPGIHWIGDGLGYFYHSHGPEQSRRGEHGHFHLFAQQLDCRGHASGDSYAHLVGIAVDATGAPLRVFTTNLWVTAGRWRCAAFICSELKRFARNVSRPDSGPERWIGSILSLYPAEVRKVLRLREQRVGHWRRERMAERRLADRRIHTLSSISLALSATQRS